MPRRDFRLHLHDELTRRVRDNPRYSMRAFARFLGIENSFLSKILSGKRSITPPVFEHMATRLSLEPQQLKFFRSQLPNKRRSTSPALNFTDIDIDKFKIISEWYHFAILELFLFDTFRPSVKWISEKLKITASEAQLALERLERLGFIQFLPNGEWQLTKVNTSTLGMKFTESALRRVQSEFLDKAKAALETVPFEKRNQSGMTMAIPLDRLKEADKMITEFRRKFTSRMQSDGKKDAVYHLSISFFPLSDVENL